MSTELLLPDSRPRVQKNVVRRGDTNWTPIFCANCGCDGGLVPEQGCNFAFYLCVPCADKLPEIDGIYRVPDEVFWQQVLDEQIAKYGRALTAVELAEVLLDGSSSLSKLARDRKDFNARKMT